MHEELKSLLKQAIMTCLPVLQPLFGQFLSTDVSRALREAL